MPIENIEKKYSNGLYVYLRVAITDAEYNEMREWCALYGKTGNNINYHGTYVIWFGYEEDFAVFKYKYADRILYTREPTVVDERVRNQIALND